MFRFLIIIAICFGILLNGLNGERTLSYAKGQTKPEILIQPFYGDFTNSARPTLSGMILEKENPLMQAWYKWDEGKWTRLTLSPKVTVLPFELKAEPLQTGKHTLSIRAENAEGETVDKQYEFVVDLTPPQLHLIATEDISLSEMIREGAPSHLKGVAGDPESRVISVLFSADGGDSWNFAEALDENFDGYEETFQLKLDAVSKGEQRLEIMAVNGVGLRNTLDYHLLVGGPDTVPISTVDYLERK